METIHELIENYMNNQDKAILGKIVEQLKTTDSLWSIKVRATNNFYLGAENEKPSAYLFTDKTFADNFLKDVKWGGIESKCLEIKADQRNAFFSDLYRSGFEAVTIDKGEDFLVISLLSIIEKENSEEAVMNPPLVRAANQFYQELARKQAFKAMQDLLSREIFKASFLVPVAGASEGEGRHLTERTAKQTYAVLSTQNGKKYLPVFTDWSEFAKYDKKKSCDAVLAGFGELKKLLRKVDGIALNPFGFNLILDGKKLENIQGMDGKAPEGKDGKVISLKDRR